MSPASDGIRSPSALWCLIGGCLYRVSVELEQNRYTLRGIKDDLFLPATGLGGVVQ